MLDKFLQTSRAQWKWIAAIWFSIGCFDATQTVFSMRAAGMHHAWVSLFITLFFAWIPMMLATPFFLELARRFPPTRLRTFSTWTVHLSAICASCLLSSAWIAMFEHVMNPWADPSGPPAFLPRVSVRFISGIVSYFVLYVAILGIGYALDSKERLARERMQSARLSEALSKAQLEALRRQIEPHFLFNALNAITGLVREGRNDAAVKMIAGLSDFLRRVIADNSRQEVPLAEEVDFVQRYLEIQKIRFADRLAVQMDVPGELLQSQVPCLILQPMVENAIKHGISHRARGGEIRITACRSNGTLTLKVFNDGPSLPQQHESSGIGISNIRTRLQSLYGSSFHLTLKNEPAGGVEASISLPFKEA